MRIGGKSNRSLKGIVKKTLEDFLIIKKNKAGGFLTLFYKNFSKLKQFLNNMCGFIASFGQNMSHNDFYDAMNHLKRRGPDAEGVWNEKDVFLVALV